MADEDSKVNPLSDAPADGAGDDSKAGELPGGGGGGGEGGAPVPGLAIEDGGEDGESEAVVKKKKKKRADRPKPEKVEVTLEDIERRLAKSFVYRGTQKQGCKDIKVSIDPRGSFTKRWDIVMIVCLVWTALVTPYEIAFLPDSGIDNLPLLWWLNRLVDFSFGIDMVVNFFLGFFDDEEGQWVFENKRIALRYLKGWFSVDLISILPFEEIGAAMENDALKNLKVLRTIRLLRLIKLARVFRASRLFKRWELSMDMSYSTLSLIKFLVLVFISVHWMASAWRLGPSLEEADDNWIRSVFDDGDSEIREDHVQAPFDLYMSCVYVAIIALPMGVGDIVPVTTAERVLCIAMMLIGGSIYAYVIGAICGVVSTRDPATTEFHQTMDHLNTFLAEINTPQKKRREIREYFHHCRQLFRSQYYHELLYQMSPKLRGDIALHCHRQWVEQITFFRAESEEERSLFITHIALTLKLEAYAPKELIIKTGEFTEKMYIIQRGLVARLGRVLGAGRFFGEDVILHNSRRNYFVRVLTYLDVYSLSKTDLEDILENGDFPQTRRIIRQSAIRLALTREFCRIADQVRMARLLGRRLSTVDIPKPKMLADKSKLTGDLTPRDTVLDRENAPRRRSAVAQQTQVEFLQTRVNTLEEKMDRLVGGMTEGFQMLRSLAVGDGPGSPGAAGGMGGPRRLAPLGPSVPDPRSNLTELWDNLESEKEAADARDGTE
mmetsp:Transcript_47020/g.112706  ORF Transcript_47020/g.112706 Transcript_47020/m.112706 type:complete len:721 (+) Transcript_47020:374-2536(+)